MQSSIKAVPVLHFGFTGLSSKDEVRQRSAERCRMQNVFCMGAGQAGIDVDQYEGIGTAFERNGKGAGAADKTATHNSDSHKPCLLPFCWIIFSRNMPFAGFLLEKY